MSKAIHYINFAIIFIFLVGICVLEETLVSKSLSQIQSQVYKIERVVQDKNSLLEQNIVLLVDNLEDAWAKDESALCYLVNHKSIQEIGEEIAELKACIIVDDIDEFKINLVRINLHCQEYMHFMGASLHNIL